jgi:hypothetical protein
VGEKREHPNEQEAPVHSGITEESVQERLTTTIAPFYYTTPLLSITRMLAGKQRKAPLFVGREQVEGG